MDLEGLRKNTNQKNSNFHSYKDIWAFKVHFMEEVFSHDSRGHTNDIRLFFGIPRDLENTYMVGAFPIFRISSTVLVQLIDFKSHDR